MGPEKWKGELPGDEAAEQERGARKEEEQRGSTATREAGHEPIDEREEEGYDQPESSAQKHRPEDEEMGE